MDKTKKPAFEIDYNNFSNTGAIQKFINKQLWTNGGLIVTQANNTTTTTVKWGGQSRFLIGFNFWANNPSSHTLTVVLNQETVIDNVNIAFLTSSFLGNQKFLQYFEFIRPLSGADTLIFSVNSDVSENLYYSVYMTRAYNRYYVRD